MEQPTAGQLWECFELSEAESKSPILHPFIDLGDIIEIIDDHDAATLDVYNLRTGMVMRENRYRIAYCYRRLNT